MSRPLDELRAILSKKRKQPPVTNSTRFHSMSRADTALTPLFVFFQLVSSSYFYCMSRPLSNSLETSLTIAALALWPWQVTCPPHVPSYVPSTERC